MPMHRPWRVAAGVGAATVVLAGLGAAAYAGNAFDLRDQSVPGNVELTHLSDDSANGADSDSDSANDTDSASANGTGNDSTDSPFDTAGDTGDSAASAGADSSDSSD